MYLKIHIEPTYVFGEGSSNTGKGKKEGYRKLAEEKCKWKNLTVQKCCILQILALSVRGNEYLKSNARTLWINILVYT